MKIIIDISKEDYEWIKESDALDYGVLRRLKEAIRSRTLLPKGKWTSATLGGYTCSNCNKEFTYPRFIGRALYYYCPNCGAKMEAEHMDKSDAPTIIEANKEEK